MYVWTMFCIFFLFFFLLISVVYILTFLFDRYNIITNKILSGMAWMMLRVSPRWKMEIEGEEKYVPGRPTIFIANHESFMDIPFIFQLPWKMKWVVKHSMTYIPVMGWMVKLTGHLTINRSNKTALRKLENLVEPIKNGIPVMIFPEGTRSLDGKLKSFKNGAFLLAMENDFMLQPIVVDGVHELLPSGKKLFSPNARLKLSVLDAIDPKDFDTMPDLRSFCHQIIEKEQQRLNTRE